MKTRPWGPGKVVFTDNQPVGDTGAGLSTQAILLSSYQPSDAWTEPARPHVGPSRGLNACN